MLRSATMAVSSVIGLIVFFCLLHPFFEFNVIDLCGVDNQVKIRSPTTSGDVDYGFGTSVSISGNGNIFIVGTDSDEHPGHAAYIFIRSGNVWHQQAKLIAQDGGIDDRFGASVALSSDGMTAIIGASNKAVNQKNNFLQGAAYIFTRTGNVWRQQAELTALDGGINDRFGASVALSSDGMTAIIGASEKIIGGKPGQGAAYIFTRTGNVWHQQAKLTAQDGGPYDLFGDRVDLSADAYTVIVTADFATIENKFKQGAAYIFIRSGNVWHQQAKLTALDGGMGNLFGSSVSMSFDGETVIIGADSRNSRQGASYVFERSNATWHQQARLTALDGSINDGFGSSVDMSRNGSVIIGSYAKYIGNNNNQGAAYIFTRADNIWRQKAELIAKDGRTDDRFGISVAISSDGKVATVGSDGISIYGRNNNNGAAYVFQFLRSNLIGFLVDRKCMYELFETLIFQN